jgi:hypothetical protein
VTLYGFPRARSIAVCAPRPSFVGPVMATVIRVGICSREL